MCAHCEYGKVVENDIAQVEFRYDDDDEEENLLMMLILANMIFIYYASSFLYGQLTVCRRRQCPSPVPADQNHFPRVRQAAPEVTLQGDRNFHGPIH